MNLERLKSWDGMLLLIGLVFCVAFVLASCSGEDVTDPSTAQAQTQVALSDADEEVVERERLLRLGELGIDLDGTRGVFALGFREHYNRREETSEQRGGAHAVVFSEPFDADSETLMGVDVGTVTVKAPAGDVELNKRDGKRGVRYSTRKRRIEGGPTDLGYAAGATYTFDVSGSDDFAPTSFDLTAPAALIEISNLAHGDEVDPGADLTIEWSGGSDGKVMVAVIAPKPRQQGKRGRRGECPGECDGQHQGRHGDRGGPGQGRGGRGHGGPGGRPDLDDAQVYREILDSNAGQFTLSAAQVQELLAASGSDKLMVHIGQAIATEFDQDGETLIGVVRNGDRVGLIATLTQ